MVTQLGVLVRISFSCNTDAVGEANTDVSLLEKLTLNISLALLARTTYFQSGVENHIERRELLCCVLSET